VSPLWCILCVRLHLGAGTKGTGAQGSGDWRRHLKRLLGIPGVVLLSLAVAAADDRMTWEKADGVLAKSAATGKPVIWFFLNNQFSKDAPAAITIDGVDKAEKAFNNPVILKRRDPFLWVRGDQTLATSFKVQGAPVIIITDADGDVIHRAPIASPENLYEAMQLVLKEKYIDVPIVWGDVVRTGPITKKLLVVGFDCDKGEALKSLEDKTLVKYHKNCEFVKLPYKKDSETAKKWSVDRNPSIVICDPMERVLEKVSGRVTPVHVKMAMMKAMAKLDKPARK
jgi:hypothetical protein